MVVMNVETAPMKRIAVACLVEMDRFDVVMAVVLKRTGNVMEKETAQMLLMRKVRTDYSAYLTAIACLRGL